LFLFKRLDENGNKMFVALTIVWEWRPTLIDRKANLRLYKAVIGWWTCCTSRWKWSICLSFGCLDDRRRDATYWECGPPDMAAVVEDFLCHPHLTCNNNFRWVSTTKRITASFSQVSHFSNVSLSFAAGGKLCRITSISDLKNRKLKYQKKMAGRFSGLHITLPGLGTILLRPSAGATTRTAITLSSNLPPIHQVSLSHAGHTFSLCFPRPVFILYHGWFNTIELLSSVRCGWYMLDCARDLTNLDCDNVTKDRACIRKCLGVRVLEK
jgi:hypothetical protein